EGRARGGVTGTERGTVEAARVRRSGGDIGTGVGSVVTGGVRCVTAGDDAPAVLARGHRAGTRVRGNAGIGVPESLVRLKPEIVQLTGVVVLQDLCRIPDLGHLECLAQRSASGIHCLALPDIKVNERAEVRVRM